MTHPFIPALHSPLSGVQLIEASAGTGKTWTLSALFARLIVERKFEAKDILAITFTKAAAAELRDRIRKRLVELKLFLEAGQPENGDIFCQHMLNVVQQRGQTEAAIDRLNYAVLNFDEATITTINGFCQGVLVEQALASGMPMESELVSDISSLLHDIIQDYCRQQWRQAEPLLVAYVLARDEFSITNLYKFVSSILQQGHAHIECAEFYLNNAILGRSQKCYRQAQQLWLNHSAEIRTLFSNDCNAKVGILSGYSTYLDSWLEQLDVALSSNILAVLDTKSRELLSRFSQTTLVDKRKKAAIEKGLFFPEHALFSVLDELVSALEDCQKQLEIQALKFKYELITHCRHTLQQRLQERQAQSFDMQIKGLAHALDHEQMGVELAQRLREQYPAALVDEFQDTDNYQYRILQKVYLQPQARHKPCALFLVGDPKQAIYRFRGADVYTYLQAYDDVALNNRHQLHQNQRSVSPLIHALNQFFTVNPDTFKQEKIRYHAVSAGERSHLPLQDTRESSQPNPQPLRLLYNPASQTTAEQGRTWAVQTCVNEIVRLLDGAAHGHVQLGDKPLAGKDIVILVRTHFEADMCQAALAKAGIKAAVQSRNRVFKTPEADDMARVLAAFADPFNEGKVRAVLASRLCGATVSQLLAWQTDARAWTAHLVRFQGYHQRWQQRGFVSAWRHFLQQEGAIARLAALTHGERIITNFLHLADLLHEEYRQRSGIRQLCEWFARQRQEPEDSEGSELRLESDENLIKIITIHQSKGLEFPVVFIPMLWTPPDPKKGTPFYHHDGKGVFDLRPTLPPEIEQKVADEVLSEDLRLGYVALTRAAQRCYVLWSPLASKGKTVASSALGHWLPDGIVSMHALQQQHPDTIGVSAIAETEAAVLASGLQTDSRPLTASTAPPIPRGYRLTSFSSLQQGAKALHSTEEGLEAKDDDGKTIVLASEHESVKARFNFAGKKVPATHVGNCLHQIFEHANFVEPVSEWQDNIKQRLMDYGIISSWQEDVTEWLAEVMAAPLSPTLQLRQLATEQTLRELDFHLPLHRFRTTRFIDCLRRHGVLVGDLPFQQISGFLKGSIDLVFQHQGQYFIADYKSNHLGHQLADYQPDKLGAAMTSHGYALQAAIYALALHRWLGSRLQHYEPRRHLGGVYYLFLRGMHPDGNEGIHFWQPSEALLNEMSQLLGDTP